MASKSVSSLKSDKESLDECKCTICMYILIEPVTLPCGHELCMPCFKQTVEEASFTCPLCRTRISNWARKATKSNTLVDQKRWEQVRKLFPEKVQRRLDGLDDETDEDDTNDNEEIDVQYRRIVQLSKPGEIREEYEAEVKRLAQRAEEERRREEEASAALIQELVTADNEHFQENRLLQEQIARQDEKFAKELAEHVDITDAENPLHSIRNKAKGSSLSANPSHLSDGDFKEKGKQHANMQGNKTLKTFFRSLGAVVKPGSSKEELPMDAHSKLSVNELPQKNSQESHQTFQQRSPNATFVKTTGDTVLESEHEFRAICQESDCEETVQHQVQRYEVMSFDPKASDSARIELMQNLDSNTNEKFRQQTVRGSLLTSDHALTCADYVTPHQEPVTHSLTQWSAGVTTNATDLITSTSLPIIKHSLSSRIVAAGENPVDAYKTGNMGSTWSGIMGGDSCEKSELRANGKYTQESSAGQDRTTDQQTVLKKEVVQSSPPARKVVLQDKLTPVATERHEAWSWQTLSQESSSKDKIGKDFSPSVSPTPNKNGHVIGKDLSSIPPIVPGHTSSMSRLVFNRPTPPEWSGGFYADVVSSNKAVPSVEAILDTVENVTVFKTTNSHLTGSIGKAACNKPVETCRDVCQDKATREAAGNKPVETLRDVCLDKATSDEAAGNKPLETLRDVCLDAATHGMSMEESRENQEISNLAPSDDEKNVLAKSSTTRRRRNATKTRSSSATVEKRDLQNLSPQRSIKDWLSPFPGNMQGTSVDPDSGNTCSRKYKSGADRYVVRSSSESTAVNPCAKTLKTKTSVHMAKTKNCSVDTLLLSSDSKGVKSKLETVFKDPTKNESQTSCKRKVLKNQDSNSEFPGVSPSKSRKDSGDSSNEDDEAGLTPEERDHRFALQLQKQFHLADKFHLKVLRFKGSNDAYSLRNANQHK